AGIDIPKVAPSHAEAQWPVATFPHLPLRGQRRNCYAKACAPASQFHPQKRGHLKQARRLGRLLGEVNCLVSLDWDSVINISARGRTRDETRLEVCLD